MAVKYQDYYQVLGVKRDVTQQEIQRAYRKLAREYHPDVNKEKDAEAQFALVGEAYEVLKDQEKRKKYDALGANWKAGQEFRPPPGFENFHFEFRHAGDRGEGGPGGGFRFSPGGFSDFFEMFFGQSRQAKGAHPGTTPRPAEQEASITISLEESYRGATRRLTLQGPNGQKDVEVKIPPGVTSGSKIRLSGEGLILKIEISPDPRFEIEGHDLVTDLPVAPWEAALGAKVPLQTLDGPVTLTVPPGAQSGSRLRLRNKGMPKRDGEKGDLFARLRIVVPKTLTGPEKKLFKQLQENSKFKPRDVE